MVYGRFLDKGIALSIICSDEIRIKKAPPPERGWGFLVRYYSVLAMMTFCTWLVPS